MIELVSPFGLPRTPDPDAVAAAGREILTTARRVSSAVDGAVATWNALPASLSAPGAIEPLYGALAPAEADASDLVDASARLERAVDAFAGEIHAVRRRSASLEQAIVGFYARYGAEALVDTASVLLDTVTDALTDRTDLAPFLRDNDALLAEVRALDAHWSAVQQEAAAAILAITSGEARDLPRTSGAGGSPDGDALSAVLALESLGVAARRGSRAVQAWRERYPQLAALLHADAPDAVFVHSWWQRLGSAAQHALVVGIPAVLGDLNGVAYAARARANRTVLGQEIDAYEAKVTADEASLSPAMGVDGTYGASGVRASLLQARLAADRAQLAAYRNILLALSAQGGTTRSLVELDTGFQPPLAAVAIGDLDTARTVTYAVPGMTATTAGMSGWTGAAQAIYTAQNMNAAGSFAVVAWVGYKTPAAPPSDWGVLTSGDAAAGAVRLDAALSGVNAVRGDDVVLNVVAHSYGTTTAALALAGQDEHIHSFVMVGSAGIDASVPDAGAIGAAHVYAGQASDALPVIGNTQGDQWAWIGRDFSGRANPMDPSFGATTFGTDGGADGALTTAHDTTITDPGLANGYGYLDPGTESLYNVARATTSGTDMTGYDPDGSVRLTPVSVGLLDGVQLEALREAPIWVLRQMGFSGPVLDRLAHAGVLP